MKHLLQSYFIMDCIYSNDDNQSAPPYKSGESNVNYARNRKQERTSFGSEQSADRCHECSQLAAPLCKCTRQNIVNKDEEIVFAQPPSDPITTTISITQIEIRSKVSRYKIGGLLFIRAVVVSVFYTYLWNISDFIVLLFLTFQ